MTLKLILLGIGIFVLGYAAGRLSASIDYPKLPHRPLPGPGEPVEPTIAALLRRGRRLAAIRRFRRIYGTDSATARQALDAIQREANGTPGP